jgi:hypothetical protein
VTDPLTLAPGWPPQLERSSRQARPRGVGADSDGTEKERERIREERVGWLHEDPEGVAERYREGELDTIDHGDG